MLVAGTEPREKLQAWGYIMKDIWKLRMSLWKRDTEAP